MKYVSILSLLAVLHLSLLPTLGYADAKGDAETYVAKSIEVARETAHNIFLQQLMNAAVSTAVQANAMDPFVARIKDVEQAKADLRAYLADTTIELKKREKRTPGELAKYARRMADDYSEALRGHLGNQLVILDSQSNAAKVFEAVDKFVDQMDQICTAGMGANIDLPDLPPRQPMMPVLDVRVNATYDGSGVSVQPQAPTGAMPSMPNFPAWSAVTAAVGTAVAASVISGKVIMSGAAMMALTASQALLATGIGAGVALVLGTIVFALETERAIKESNEVADAQYVMFRDKANAITVAEEYKKICRPVVAGLLEAKQLVRDLRDQKTGASERYAALASTAAPLLKGFQEAQDKVRIRQAELTKTISKMDAVNDELRKSSEYQSYVAYMKQIGEVGFGKITQAGLISLALGAHNVADWAKESRKDILTIELDRLSESLKALNFYSYLQSIESQKTGALESLSGLMKSHKELAQLYFEFDRLSAQYIDDIYAVGFARAAGQDLKNWAKRLSDFEKKYSGALGLSVLSTKWANFTLAMGIK